MAAIVLCLFGFFGQEAGDAAGRCSIKHAVISQRDAFTGFGIGNKSKDFAGPGAADIGALLAFAVVVGGVKRVVLGDKQPAGMIELAVFRQILAILIKALDADVDAIGHQQAPLGVEHQSMGIAELTGLGTQAAPRFD